MLLEPYVYLYIMALIYNNLVALIAMIGYTVCMLILSFWNWGENRKYQLMLLILFPLNFFLQFGITVVEYIYLWKLIFNVKHIIHYYDNKVEWKYVKSEEMKKEKSIILNIKYRFAQNAVNHRTN